MPVDKMSGKVISSKTGYYSSTYVPVRTRYITYVKGKRKIKISNDEVAVRRKKIISYAGGKSITYDDNYKKPCCKIEKQKQIYVISSTPGEFKEAKPCCKPKKKDCCISEPEC
jgi:hypothetical protein